MYQAILSTLGAHEREWFQLTQLKVLESTAHGQSLTETLLLIVDGGERAMANSACAVELLHLRDGVVEFAAGSQHIAAYYRTRGHVVDLEAAGTCRAVVSRIEQVAVPSLATDQTWKGSRELALQHGIRSALSTPVTDRAGEVLAIVTFFFPQSGSPSEVELSVAQAFAYLVSLTIQLSTREERARQELQSLISHCADGVIAVNAHGMVLTVNNAAKRLLGLSSPVGSPSLQELGLPREISEILLRVTQSSRQLRQQCTVGPLDLDIQVAPVVIGLNQHAGFLALVRDVTREARFERMQESFVANVSHELRGPLAALSAMVEAIRDGKVTSQTQQRYLDSILVETRRLKRLTDDILKLSRIDAGAFETAHDPISLETLFHDIHQSWALRFAAAGLELVVETPPFSVLGDYHHTWQVVSNLLENAIKFSAAGGTIRLYTSEEHDFVRISVTDFGCGIAPEHLLHVWERFFKVDDARTRTEKAGSGLGLSICKQLVERMGGTVDGQSELGRGSTFSFTLRSAP